MAKLGEADPVQVFAYVWPNEADNFGHKFSLDLSIFELEKLDKLILGPMKPSQVIA